MMAKKMTPLFEDFLPVSPTKRTTTPAPKVTPTPVVTPTPLAEDPYYIRDPRTGLSPAQVEAQNAAKEAAAEARKLGIPAVFTPGPAGTAGRVTVTPRTVSTPEPPIPPVSTGGFDMAKFLADQAARDQLAADQRAKAAAEEKMRQGQSAYDLLLGQFNQYGLGTLVEPLKKFIIEGLSPAEFTLRLRETDAYKKRFAANAQRINQGLRALSEAEYIDLEDKYQDTMRRYGLPQSYYTRGDMGIQTGFEKFIAGDVSPVELEDRIQTAYNRVLKANPEVMNSLKAFYGDTITNGDILAYALDPKNAIEDIKRKVTAAEIGGAAKVAGLDLSRVARAEELAQYGITGEAARQGFQAIAEMLPRGSQLAEFYASQEVRPYTQTTAEQEVFGLPGAAEAGRQRKKLTELERASFSGSSGVGALARDRAGTL